MVDQVTFRTTDFTRWGPGQGFNLSKSQIDINFWVLLTRVLTLEGHQNIAGRGIETFFQLSGDNAHFYALLTDGTQLGPYSLPNSPWNFTNPPTGAFLPNFSYHEFDVFNNSVSVYIVLRDHTSAATFDPNATNGLGNNLYGLLLSSYGVPTGGRPGQVLGKASITNFDTEWVWHAISTMFDVALTSPLDNGMQLVWDSTVGFWTNKSPILARPVVEILGTTYVPTIDDSDKFLQFTNPAGCTVYLDAGVFAVGTELELYDDSTVTTGGLSVVAQSPAIIKPVYGYLTKSDAFGATLGVKQIAAHTWTIAGLLEKHP